MGIGALYSKTIRRFLPHVTSDFSGITVMADQRWGERLLERLVGRKLDGTDNPEYETGLVEGIKACVRPGDRVVVIGGGLGVTAAWSVRQAGPSGSVVCFEGGANEVLAVRNTGRLNGLEIDVRHAFVGNADNVRSSLAGASEIAIADLPECDVLEMDCEGAELEIIRSMTIRPRDILVETHGQEGSSSADVRSALTAIGYAVEDKMRLPDRIAGLSDYERADIFVLFAHRP
jgi:hypothetical protein